MINPHESMGPGRGRTRDPWICSQTRICSQTGYRLRYVARSWGFEWLIKSEVLLKVCFQNVNIVSHLDQTFLATNN